MMSTKGRYSIRLPYTTKGSKLVLSTKELKLLKAIESKEGISIARYVTKLVKKDINDMQLKMKL